MVEIPGPESVTVASQPTTHPPMQAMHARMYACIRGLAHSLCVCVRVYVGMWVCILYG